MRRASGTRRMLLVAMLAAVTLCASACFVTPIEQPGLSAPSSAPLRDGPQTAVLPSADITPIAPDPTPILPTSVDTTRHGRVTVTDVSRIIAVDINGTLGSIVFSLGMGDRVVGRDASTVFPAAVSRPVVTNRGHSLNAEAVLALAPTILLINDDTVPTAAIDQVRDSGVTVVTLSAVRNLATNDDLIRTVAKALGVVGAGEKLVARTDAQLTAAKRLVPDPSGDPTIAFVYLRGRNLMLLAGPGSGADDLIRELGARDAADRAELSGAFTAISAEAMIRADPDVLLVMTEGADSVGGIDGVLTLPGIAETKAGRNRRVVQMSETKILAFGPDVGEVVGALAKAIYA